MPLPEPTPQSLPRWRGFNLLEKFLAEKDAPYREADFALLADWGFNFVRLPMSYLCWTDPQDLLTFHEEVLAEIDQAIEWGRQYSIHVNLNVHRAPGYCVNPPAEPLDLWNDTEAMDLCAHHWHVFARRYKGIPNSQLSFNLVNEPADIPESAYTRVVAHLVSAIRAGDLGRLIIADGRRWGTQPTPALAYLHIAQSTRGYAPFGLTHYRAPWVKGSEHWPVPAWPMPGTPPYTQEIMHREMIVPWQSLESTGVGVHVGEWGAFIHTPHDVALRWMHANLQLWQRANWGWALWNLRGGFGILDSGRHDTPLEPFRGHMLDRKMLELLQAF